MKEMLAKAKEEINKAEQKIQLLSKKKDDDEE